MFAYFPLLAIVLQPTLVHDFPQINKCTQKWSLATAICQYEKNEIDIDDHELEALAYAFSVIGLSQAKQIVPIALNFQKKYGFKTVDLAQRIFIIWGEIAAPVVAEHLKSEDSRLLLRTISLLGKMKSKKYLDEIICYRWHKNTLIRHAVVYAMSEIHDRRAILPLLDIAWNEKDEEIRINACYAIATFGTMAKGASKSLEDLVFKRSRLPIAAQGRFFAALSDRDDPCHPEIFALIWIGPSNTQFLERILMDENYLPLHKTIFSTMLSGRPDNRSLYKLGRKKGRIAIYHRNDLLLLAREYFDKSPDGRAGKDAKRVIKDFETGD